MLIFVPSNMVHEGIGVWQWVDDDLPSPGIGILASAGSVSKFAFQTVDFEAGHGLGGPDTIDRIGRKLDPPRYAVLECVHYNRMVVADLAFRKGWNIHPCWGQVSEKSMLLNHDGIVEGGLGKPKLRGASQAIHGEISGRVLVALYDGRCLKI
jgi:hypothetical protein